MIDAMSPPESDERSNGLKRFCSIIEHMIPASEKAAWDEIDKKAPNTMMSEQDVKWLETSALQDSNPNMRDLAATLLGQSINAMAVSETGLGVLENRMRNDDHPPVKLRAAIALIRALEDESDERVKIAHKVIENAKNGALGVTAKMREELADIANEFLND